MAACAQGSIGRSNVNFTKKGVQFYRVSGLSVASEIDLPGMIAGAPERAPQVTIRLGPVPEQLPDSTAIGPTWQIAGKQFLLGIPNIARFLLNDGSDIVVAPESEAGDADIPVFILGTVFGILLHQREQIVLHASAVRVNGKAVLFAVPRARENRPLPQRSRSAAILW